MQYSGQNLFRSTQATGPPKITVSSSVPKLPNEITLRHLAMLRQDSEELFTATEDNWCLEGWLAQLGWIGALAHEGGLFVTVGRRI
jgi:hypothetical protein